MGERTTLFWKIALLCGAGFGVLFSLLMWVAGIFEPEHLWVSMVSASILFGLPFGWIMSRTFEPVSHTWHPEDVAAFVKDLGVVLASLGYAIARDGDEQIWKPGFRAGVMAGAIRVRTSDGHVRVSGPKYYVERLQDAIGVPGGR